MYQEHPGNESREGGQAHSHQSALGGRDQRTRPLSESEARELRNASGPSARQSSAQNSAVRATGTSRGAHVRNDVRPSQSQLPTKQWDRGNAAPQGSTWRSAQGQGGYQSQGGAYQSQSAGYGYQPQGGSYRQHSGGYPPQGGYQQQIPYTDGARVKPATAYSTCGRVGGGEPPVDQDGVKRKRVLKVVGIIVGILLAIYLGGFIYFSNYYFPSSTIGPVEVSGMTVSEATEALEEEADNYQIEVGDDNVTFTLAGADAGLELDGEVIAENAMSENKGWTWPVALLFPHDYSDALSASTDKDTLANKIEEEVEAYNDTAVAPENACIDYDEDSGSIVIVEEVEGDSLDAEAVTSDVQEAISALSDSLELTDDDYLHPTLTSDNENLIQAKEEASVAIRANLTLQIAGTTVETLDVSTIGSWITSDSDGNFKLSKAFKTWCSEVDAEYTTVGSTRKFTDPDGDTITVTGGDYGWDVDYDSLVKKVRKSVRAGENTTMDIPMSQEADCYDPDTGLDFDSYIDVDISEQHATYYDTDGSVLWEADVVTGKPTASTATSRGVYSITNKESPSTLVGYNLKTGKKKYETEVTYWMPFDGNVIGFHDATWQSAFGGTRYKDGYGSNGCVNLSLKKAKALYKLVEIGTVVVSHK